MKNKIVGSYSRGSKALHWIVAVIVILMLSFGFFLDDVPAHYQSVAYMVHKSLGLTILLLMLVRLFWIIRQGKPALPNSVSPSEKMLSKAVQSAFYVFLLAMPLSGWILSVAENRIPRFFGLFDVPLYGIPLSKALAKIMQQEHLIIAWILIGLVVLHVAGALKHYFYDKDRVLQRML